MPKQTKRPKARVRRRPPSSPPAACRAPAPEVLEWRVHLVRSSPARGAVLAVVVAAVGGLCFYLFRSLPFALFSVLALLGATAEYLFPIRFRLTPEGAEMRNLHNWRRISWAEVRKVYLLDEGVKLSPLPHGGPREAFRGVMLRWEERQKSGAGLLQDQVIDYVERRVAQHRAQDHAGLSGS